MLDDVAETLWLTDDVAVGVGGGVIVLVIDRVNDAEVDVDGDTLLDRERDTLRE